MHNWKEIVALRLPAATEADLIIELAQHLEDRYRDLLRGDAVEAEAYRQTCAELDDLKQLRTSLERRRFMQRSDFVPPGDTRSHNFPADIWKDLRYALRSMRRNPVFALFVILTLGSGIAVNTTVFTLIDSLILHPLPVRDAQELVSVTMTESKAASKSAAPLPVSYPDLKDYVERNDVFQSLAGYTAPRVITMESGNSPERMFAEVVSGNYFSTLRLDPAAGRFFARDEDAEPGSHPVTVLNYATWQQRFGGSREIVGHTVRINHIEFTVVGVAPPNFIGVNAIFGPDMWVPAAMAEQLLPGEMRGSLTDRGRAEFLAIGRLKPGTGRERAQANLSIIASALAQAYPETSGGHEVLVRPVRDALFASASSGVSPVLFGSVVLMIVVAVVLLIACSNVASLLLARAAARRQELSVRLAIGASRGRLIRQLLTESVLFGCLSGVLGFAMGWGGVQLLWSSLPSAANFSVPKLDPAVFAFTLLVSLLTGFAFGTIPALRASRIDLAESLKEESHAAGRSRGRVTLGNILLVGQVAFSFLLLAMAAMFVHSIARAYQIDPGFEVQHLAVFMTNPGQAGYNESRSKSFYKEAGERVAALPGVESVSWASDLPLWARRVSGLEVEGRQARSRTDTLTSVLNIIDIHYFETAGIPIQIGRAFGELDRQESMPVAIVNQKVAQDFWPNQCALGKRIRLPGETLMRQIVGVARNANYSTLAEAPQFCVYVPLRQDFSGAMTLYVRTSGDPNRVLAPVQRELRSAGPNLFLNDARTGRTIVDNGLFQAKMGVTLLAVFGLLALGLASVGLYGIVACSVGQRTREIGVRIALGATRTVVLSLILKEGMSLVVTGVLIGFAGALLAGRVVGRILFGVSGNDLVSAGGAALALLAVALVACYLPARRASRLDPLNALREG